jgi:hypothetical protein
MGSPGIVGFSTWVMGLMGSGLRVRRKPPLGLPDFTLAAGHGGSDLPWAHGFTGSFPGWWILAHGFVGCRAHRRSLTHRRQTIGNRCLQTAGSSLLRWISLSLSLCLSISSLTLSHSLSVSHLSISWSLSLSPCLTVFVREEEERKIIKEEEDNLLRKWHYKKFYF